MHVPIPLRHHPWRVLTLALALACLGLVLSVVSAYWLREHPGARSLSAALNGLPHSVTTSVASGVRYPPPPPGVYKLAGSGSEHISFPPNSQSDGAVMPVSVTVSSVNCWRWRVDYNVAHWEDYDFCAGPQGLLELQNRNSQSWDFGSFTIGNLATFTCAAGTTMLPADPTPGKTLTWTCTGKNSTVPGITQATTTAQIVDLSNVDIGTTAVRAVHERQSTTLTGSQTGSVVADWWLESTNGLPLQVDRRITVATSSPIGDITYTETGSWRVASLSPRR